MIKQLKTAAIFCSVLATSFTHTSDQNSNRTSMGIALGLATLAYLYFCPPSKTVEMAPDLHVSRTWPQWLGSNMTISALGSANLEVTQDRESEKNVPRIRLVHKGKTHTIDASNASSLVINQFGSGSLSVKGLTFPTFKVNTSGSGRISVQDTTSTSMLVKKSGSGNVAISDSSTSCLKVAGSGSGSTEIRKVKSILMDIKGSGSGNLALMNAFITLLKVTMSGSGNIHLQQTEPDFEQIAISGSGTCTKFP